MAYSPRNTNGQKTMANSAPIVIASDQTVIPISDNAGSITVDGTVTANAGTGPWPVTDNGGSLTVDNNGTFAVQASLSAGGATIGSIASITTSIVPGTAATNLGKAEDAAHVSGDTGVFMLSVRNDNLATTFAADQDYNPIATDLKGRVNVRQTASTSTHSNISTSTTSATLIAANAARIGGSIFNDAAANLYIATNGSAASATNFKVIIAPSGYFEIPAGITTLVTGVLASGTGTARVDEDS